MRQGRIIKAYNSFFYIETEEGELVAKLRGKMKNSRADLSSVFVGDFVRATVLPDGSGVIEERLPRKNALLRPPVANVDQIAVTVAAAEPAFHPLLVNRFLVLAEYARADKIFVVATKTDLLPAGERENFLADWEKIGYEVLRLSAKENFGLDALGEKLSGKLTAFVGASGVGKSSLLNALSPGLDLAVGDMSKISRGKNTTRFSLLIPVAGGYAVDTPGFGAVDLGRIDKAELPALFPDFLPFIGKCRFSPCAHSHEPNCAVKDAVAEGKISAERYDAYINILKTR